MAKKNKAPKDKAQKKPPLPGHPVVYKRARWLHASKMFCALIIVFLNVGIIGSAIERHNRGMHLQWQGEMITGSFVLFADLAILIPMILEADSVVVTDEKLVLKLLLFRRSVRWADIKDFKSPSYLRVATIRTKHCIYVLNKSQLQDYQSLANSIEQRRSHAIKTV